MAHHTYLRYECADAFGLTIASASSKAPPSNRILAVIPQQQQHQGGSPVPVVVAVTGSTVAARSLKSGQGVWQVGHREPTPIGTGRALNSEEVVCLDVFPSMETESIKVATGWVDGSVRIFEVFDHDDDKAGSLVHSLLLEDRSSELMQREPLVLNGHSGSPIRTVLFDKRNKSTRLASGGSDGKVVLWDVLAESGLFRLIGHRGGISDLSFLKLDHLDGLVSSSLDGLVKIWDLQGQCCTQTIASHRGEVWAGTCQQLKDDRWRLLTGSVDGQVRVWSVDHPNKSLKDHSMQDRDIEPDKEENPDEVCRYMGTLLPPANVAVSNEKIACIHYHPNGRFVGVLHANARNVDIYAIRSARESTKKRQRRLKRRQEKEKKKISNEPKTTSGQKRGILDDPEGSDEESDRDKEEKKDDSSLPTIDPERIKASDEFEYITSLRASHKVRGFSFVPNKEKGEISRVVCALMTNALETHSIVREKREGTSGVAVAEKLSTVDFHGHPTGIRSVAISSDDRLACTVSKSVTKIWNISSRSCIQSLSPNAKKEGNNKMSKGSYYGLCTAFLPGNMHVAVGTREGHLLLIDIASGEVVYVEKEAHEGAIWNLDIRKLAPGESTVSVVTGSADKSVKFWNIESQDNDAADDDISVNAGQPMFVHTRTLQMTDDVIAVRYSKTLDPTKRLIFVSTLDCTIKVFFDDSLKMFLSLYGHKLPALAVDGSDDDVLLASSGADKSVKIWGLDFGDTHRTLHGHEDSITDLRFVRRTHNFFTASKDGSVRYWDGDRFEQILLLNGHCAEVNCLAVSHTGAFVLTGGMDRQVRVWERTNDIVFLDEERERELERMFERVTDRDEGGTAQILDRNRGEGSDDEHDDRGDNEAQSEAAVRRSVLSASSGDRLMEALERSDQEMKDSAAFRRAKGASGGRKPNMMMLGMEPAPYILWVLKTIKSAELEQSLIVLPHSHVERLIYYLIVLLKSGRGIEICSRVAVFLLKTHQNQIIATGSMAPALRELKRLIRRRIGETRDVVGFDLAALKLISKAANERKQTFVGGDDTNNKDVWAGMGLGREVAAAFEGRSKP